MFVLHVTQKAGLGEKMNMRELQQYKCFFLGLIDWLMIALSPANHNDYLRTVFLRSSLQIAITNGMELQVWHTFYHKSVRSPTADAEIKDPRPLLVEAQGYQRFLFSKPLVGQIYAAPADRDSLIT